MAHAKDVVLSVNSGSSSLKISLYRLAKAAPDERPVDLILTSSISNISAPPADFSFSFADPALESKGVKHENADGLTNHSDAFAHFLDRLKESGGIDRDQISHVCHRVVHGGDYTQPTVISTETYHHIEKLSDLAPLHNGAALSVIQACLKHLPNSTSIAYFDTTFHCSIPPYISSYAIDQKIAKERGLRKYGFHGLSYAFILRAVAKFLNKPESETSLIVAHLGSGASVCAIAAGRSLDTSMGLTPLHGLPGATRSGAVDPSLIFHYGASPGGMSRVKAEASGIGVTEAEEILNKQCGWKAIAGTTDFGEIVRGRDGDEAKTLAYDLFADRILDFIGAYYLKLSGKVDALVLAGGIGERSVELRQTLAEKCACLGFSIDKAKNGRVDQVEGDVVDISGAQASEGKRLLVCRTDEQYEMARECALERKFW